MNEKNRNKALLLLNSADTTFAYVSETQTLTSDAHGVRQLLLLADDGISLADGFAADRVVGKAAALLMVRLGVRHVYADTLSRAAYDVLAAHGVDFLYRRLVSVILSRTGDDLCPMEKALLAVDDPDEAYRVIGQTAARLREMKKNK